MNKLTLLELNRKFFKTLIEKLQEIYRPYYLIKLLILHKVIRLIYELNKPSTKVFDVQKFFYIDSQFKSCKDNKFSEILSFRVLVATFKWN